MGRSILGALINYTKRRIPRLRIPRVMFTNPEMIDPVPPRGTNVSEWFVIKCPGCNTKYSIFRDTVDFVCNGPTSTGCSGNRVKYFSPSAGRYIEENRPSYFMISDAVRC